MPGFLAFFLAPPFLPRVLRVIREELEFNFGIPKLEASSEISELNKFQGKDNKWRPREQEKKEEKEEAS